MTKSLHQLIFIWIMATGLYSAMTLAGDVSSLGLLFLIPVFLLTFVFLAIKESGATVRLILAGMLLSLVLIFFVLFRFGIIEFNDKILTQILLTGAVSVSALALGEIALRFGIFRILIACSNAILLILSFFVAIPISRLFVLFALFFILITIFEEVQRGWIRSGSGSQSHLVFVFPFLFATIFFVALSPVSDKPYDWHFVRKIYSDVSSAIDNIRWELSDKYFFDPSVSLIGFSESGELHGSLTSYDAKVMDLENISFGTRQLRLRGKTFDSFTGRSWENTFTVPENEQVADAYSLIASVNSYSDKAYDLIKRSHFTIKTVYTDKDIVFSPLKTDLIYTDSFGARDIYFYSLNFDNIAFKNYLASAPMPEETGFSGEGSDISYKDYIDYTKDIKVIYTKDPGVSEKVKALTDSIYEGCESDIEKMDSLSAFLNSLSYTESPGELPDQVTDGSSFLDYFLLESGTGYCSHFATAFVLLARSEGIPARYVQGYLVPVNDSNKATVTSSMAHAWAEVYFDGAGWITYDPTPGFNVKSYWRTSTDESAGDSYLHYETPSPNESVPDTSDAEDAEKEPFDKRLVIVPLIIVFIITLLMLVIYRLVSAVSYSKKSSRDKYILICRQILIILKLSGNGIYTYETVSEYKKRLPEGILSDDFIDSLNLFLYKDTQPGDEYRDIVSATKKHLLTQLKKEKPLKYILFKMGIYGNRNYSVS